MLQFLKQDDADDTRSTIMHLELISILDSLGSVSSTRMTGSFFTRSTRLKQNIPRRELMFPEVTACNSEVAQHRASELHGHEHQMPNLHFPGTLRVNNLTRWALRPVVIFVQ
ncbi:hypothetical protein EDB83DRAFT_2411838 [Lactarius deliciosus]|nr:hypothetical protein EDB83DRAFT_2411838 [Lactarius deliciosus]